MKCPECGKENISDQAEVCPSCGHPIAAVTIEKTGKKWKKFLLLSGLICIIGAILLMAGLNSSAGEVAVGIILLFGGFIGLITSRIGAWWYHG